MTYDREFLESYLKDYLVEYNLQKQEIMLEYVKKIPKKLYRFRPANDNEINAIKNGYIWLSYANEFGDDFDSTLNYDFEKYKKEIVNIFFTKMPELLLKSIVTEFSTRYPEMDASFLTIESITQIRDEVSSLSNELTVNDIRRYLLVRHVSPADIKKIEKSIKSYFSKEYIEETTKKIVDDFIENKDLKRAFHFITCFTDSYLNSSLWELYTNKYTGFCLEYDFSCVSDMSNDDINKLFNIAPILYDEKKAIDIPRLIGISLDKYLNTNISKLIEKEVNIELNIQVRTKDKDYSFEKEWRLCIDKSHVDQRTFDFPFLKSVYLGHQIDPLIRKNITNICNELSISVYQQVKHKTKSKFVYHLLN